MWIEFVRLYLVANISKRQDFCTPIDIYLYYGGLCGMDLRGTGKAISRLRRNAGLTQAALAEKLGISDKAVSKWERGMAFPDTALLNKLSILLDTDIESLLYGHVQSDKWMGVLILDKAISVETIVYDKPLIDYLISQFLLVGIEEIVIVGKCENIYLEGVSINIIPRLNQRFTKRTFVIYGNQFTYGPNLTKHFMRAMSRDNTTVLASLQAKGEYEIKVDSDRKAILSSEDNYNRYFVLPYVFNSQSTEIDMFDRIINSKFNVETMARGMIHFNVNSYDVIYQMSGFIKMMEENTGEKIADLNEIIQRRKIV